ncbi:hypothetical protein CERSUDRAFT_113785 [Gelatoporia subvermispora B]|uniref:Uncharacterized protein n=1 Tax=Ceriporiopsis subvermispora (strain B) TaxID=914234 RepID=M2PPZ5_CERS8|nr:hypothetical protein CERSUDRAFT_113785 [Gelatoporia subvermispora B]
MPAELASPQRPQSLSTMARSKLVEVGSGARDFSLHRWVLLKNSFTRSHPLNAATVAAAAPAPAQADVNYVYRHGAAPASEQDDEDSFMFPDPGAMHGAPAGSDEGQWLDSVLAELQDDGDDDVDAAASPTSAVDEDDEPLSPLLSPMSSSDDLVSSSSFYYPPPIAIPYPVPYPPLQPTASEWYDVARSPVALLNASPFDDALPYYYADDLDEPPVPDAIEDTSDDESDAPSTPFYRSTTSLDPASVPLPPEQHPHVYIDSDDSYFYPFELDPLPSRSHADGAGTARVFGTSLYQEC